MPLTGSWSSRAKRFRSAPADPEGGRLVAPTAACGPGIEPATCHVVAARSIGRDFAPEPCARWPAPQAALGAVSVIDGRALNVSNQAASFGRPLRQASCGMSASANPIVHAAAIRE